MELIPVTVTLFVLACLFNIPKVFATTATILPIKSYANSSLISNNLLSSGPIDDTHVFLYCHKAAVCLLTCDSGDVGGLQYELTDIYNLQSLECALCGVTVIIKSGVRFRDNRIRADWNFGNMMVTRFEIDLSGITAIDSYAFSYRAFRHVETLILTNLQNAVLHNDMFSGLIALRSLKLYSPIVNDLKPGFLSGIAATLRYFTIIRQFESASAMNVDNLTGGIVLRQVKTVKIKANLNGTLSSKTFTALVRVEILSLSDCEIEVLAVDTFVPIQMTLKKLYLKRNRIKTIHPDFLKIYDVSNPSMYFRGNPWHCDCMLFSFQTYMRIYWTSIDGDTLTCTTPANLKNQFLRQVNLCSMSDAGATTLPLTTNSGAIYKQCPSSSKVTDTISIPIYRQSLILNLTRNEIGELIVTEKNNIDPSIFLIWFQTNSQNVFTNNTRDMNFNCMRLITPKTVIRDLAIDTSYTFCLMNRSSALLSPLNCGSYYQRSSEQDGTWLAEENRVWVIGSIVIGLLISALLGIIVGLLMLRQNPNWMKKANGEMDNVDGRLKLRPSVKSNNGSQKLHISSMEASNFEMTINQSRFHEVQQHLARVQNMDLADSMPYVIAPPLPVLTELELSYEQQTNNLDNRENYYSTLEDTYYKRID